MLILGIPATGPAKGPGVGALQQKRAALAADARSAVVELFGLQSQLARARLELGRVDAASAAVARERTAAMIRYEAAQRTVHGALLRLGQQLRLLYEHETPDPIAIVLGATSLDQAITGLENLSRAASATDSVVSQARSARARAEVARQNLARQAEQLHEAEVRVATTAADLQRASTEREAYLGRLRDQQAMTEAQIRALEVRAQQAQQRARRIAERAAAASAATRAAQPASPATTPAASTAPARSQAGGSDAPPPPATTTTAAATGTTATTTTIATEPRAEAAAPALPATPRIQPGSTMTVLVTAYCLTGTTSTGLPVGPGVVAVDPTVIPLGTRMSIPGYGEGVAADTGGAIRGAHIDVWIASCSEAANYTRTVTITFL